MRCWYDLQATAQLGCSTLVGEALCIGRFLSFCLSLSLLARLLYACMSIVTPAQVSIFGPSLTSQ